MDDMTRSNLAGISNNTVPSILCTGHNLSFAKFHL